MLSVQDFTNIVGDVAFKERSKYHLTLGGLIKELNSIDDKSITVCCGHKQNTYPESFHSYRGYYSDLAITPGSSPITAEQMLKMCNEALGKTFSGYKGGDFVMGENTPLWISEWGESHQLAVVGCMNTSLGFYLLTKKIDD